VIHILDILKKIALFEGLEDSDLAKVAQVTKERFCPKGTILFREGDIGDAFYLIKEGQVEVLKKDGGAEKVVKTISHTDKDNFFGEMSLVGGAPRNATLRTSTDATFLVISKTDFDMMLRLNSFIALRIMTALSSRFRAATPEAAQEVKLGKLVVIFSPKSGAGKSIFAANLASGLAKLAKAKTLLVDLDLQFGDLAFMLGLQPKRTIADLVENPTDKLEVFKEYLVDHKAGFAVLAAPKKPEQSEMINSSHLRAFVELARKHYDYVILDTHSLFQDLTINAMDMADAIYLLMLPTLNHIKSMHQCLKVMENLKYPPDKIKLILNRDGSQHARSREEIEGGMKRKVDFTLKDSWPQIAALIDTQKTVFEQDSSSEYTANMVAIMEKLTGQTFAKEGKKGWLSSLFG
jgi:Flp pilus assembly CpaE family ATPase